MRLPYVEQMLPKGFYVLVRATSWACSRLQCCLSSLLSIYARRPWLIGEPEATAEAEEPDDEDDTDSDEDALLSAFEDVLAGWANAARLPHQLASAVSLH